ncbi:MAG: GFA family protein [Desulfobulbaceae bacterium]|nr:GFA family protein [Desulfobulbaceae bacterium]
MKKTYLQTTGRCLCGEVVYKIDGFATYQLTCYCRDCQYLSGGAPNTSFTIQDREFAILTGQLKEYSRPTDSGSKVTRYFCGNCGTLVYGKSSRWKTDVSIRVGCLDEPSVFSSQMNVWVSSAQPWHKIDTSKPTYDKGPI